MITEVIDNVKYIIAVTYFNEQKYGHKNKQLSN